jgi:hypothetical protein
MSALIDPGLPLSPFSQWAHDPARSIDERYLVWLLCHATRREWWMKQDVEWQRQNIPCPGIHPETHQRYRLNPALTPRYSEEDTEFAARHASFLTVFSMSASSSSARPIRDAGALRFFPALESVSLGCSAVSDLSWLAELPGLRGLQISSGELEDFSPLALVPGLRTLSLSLTSYMPEIPAPPLLWPDVRAFAALRELEVLHFSPNAAALQGICFPRLRSAQLSCLGQRDAHCLPEMPALTVLVCEGVESLRGIGRYPELRNLTVGGTLRDFGDLPALRHLTSLTVNTQAGWPRDLSPVAALPELRVANFGGETPRNYWPLAAAPKLRALEATQGVGVALEVQAVNAALASWDGDFLAPAPRLPLPPLRLVAPKKLPGVCGAAPVPVDPDQLRDPEIFYRELAWMLERCRKRVEEMLGHGDGLETGGIYGTSRHSTYRSISFNVQSQDLAERLPELVDLLRHIMAESPHDWHFRFSIRLQVPTHLFDEQRKKWLKQIGGIYGRWRHETPEERDEEIERYRETQRHLIESAYRLRTAAEDGEAPAPEDFTPPEVVGPTGRGRPQPVAAGGGGKAPAEEDDETPDEFRLRSYDEQQQQRADEGDNQQGGEDGPAVKPDPDPPDWFWEDPNHHPLWRSYYLNAVLSRDTLWIERHHIPTAESLMRRPMDEVCED